MVGKRVNLLPLVGIGLKWLPKLGVDILPCLLSALKLLFVCVKMSNQKLTNVKAKTQKSRKLKPINIERCLLKKRCLFQTIYNYLSSFAFKKCFSTHCQTITTVLRHVALKHLRFFTRNCPNSKLVTSMFYLFKCTHFSCLVT